MDVTLFDGFTFDFEAFAGALIAVVLWAVVTALAEGI